MENKPWVQKLLTSCLQITHKGVLNWCSTISKISDSELDLENYSSIFIEKIEALYKDLIMDVDGLRKESLEKIENLLDIIKKLCNALHTDKPSVTYEDVTLNDVRKGLEKRVEEYQSAVNIRKKELQELNAKQTKLCKNLAREPRFLCESPLPVPAEIEELRMSLRSLETEAMEREKKFLQLREQIVGIVQELDAPPSSNFEKEVLSLKTNEVRITDSDMEQLDLYNSRLVKQLKSTKEETTQLRKRVEDLWSNLELDVEERDRFRQTHPGHSLGTLKALKEEVQRCKYLMETNIEVFIRKQRQELSELWTACRCTEREKDKFAFYSSEFFTEHLFQLHERELEKWRVYFQENKELLELLQKHEKIGSDLVQLDLNPGGANRYKNRGGQLLIEERQRNKLLKRLSKVEESLVKLSEAFLVRNGREFRTFGETIDQHIAKLHQDRDKEFKLRLSAKKQEREQALTVGRSPVNLFPPATSALIPTITPPNGTKRKVLATPTTQPPKQLKTVSQKTGTIPKINVSKTRRMSRKRGERRRRLSSKVSTSIKKEIPNATVLTTYGDFENFISTKASCRSTGFVLKEINQAATRLNIPSIKITSPVKNFF